MFNWVETKDMSMGLAVGLLLAGSFNDRTRLLAATAALAASVACMLIVRRRKAGQATS